jgi:peptide chain release factor subunit 1
VGARNDVTEGTLRSLAEIRADAEVVLSLYLDLDPTRFATAPARATEIDSLLDQAHREIEGGERAHDERQALRATLGRTREILTDGQGWAQGARAVALFVSEPLELERLLRLAHPLASTVVVSDAPFIAPLTEAGPSARVCVALVDERFARILRGSAEQLQEAVSFGDPVPGRHDQGGWSQARYQRSRAEDVEAHLRHVARVLHDLLRVSPYDRLMIACTQPLWPRVLSRLHADVRSRTHEERLSLDLHDAGIEDVLRAAAPLLEAEQRAHEQEVLAELREHHARNGDRRAAIGLEAVLEALLERRVRALLYEKGLRAEGVLCPRCGWMGIERERCPLDGTALERRADILEDAVASAVGQSAEVLPLDGRPDLRPLGGIAATLRF